MSPASDSGADFVEAALRAVSQSDIEQAEKLYADIIDKLEKIYGSSQKDVAAELSRIAKAIETQGKPTASFEFKQRTCELLLKRSMAQRQRVPMSAIPSAMKAAAPAPQVQNQTQPTATDVAFEKVEYMCLHAREFDAQLAYYLALPAQQVWSTEEGGGRFAALRLSEGPLLLLTDHLEARDLKSIFGVKDLNGTIQRLKAKKCHAVKAGFTIDKSEVYMFRDPAGNVFGLMARK